MVLIVGCFLMACSGALAMVPIFGLLAPVVAVVACACVGRGVAAGGRALVPGLSAIYLFVGAVHTANATHTVVLHDQRAAYRVQAHVLPAPGPAPTYAGLLRAVPHWIIAPTVVVAVALVGAHDPVRWQYYARFWGLVFAVFPLTVARGYRFGGAGVPRTA